MPFNPMHPWNALVPIVFTESGMVMSVRYLHSRNANSPIKVTVLGIAYDVLPFPTG